MYIAVPICSLKTALNDAVLCDNPSPFHKMLLRVLLCRTSSSLRGYRSDSEFLVQVALKSRYCPQHGCDLQFFPNAFLKLEISRKANLRPTSSLMYTAFVTCCGAAVSPFRYNFLSIMYEVAAICVCKQNVNCFKSPRNHRPDKQGQRVRRISITYVLRYARGNGECNII